MLECKKQPTIALFTTYAEYMVTRHCTKEAVWLKQLLAEVGYMQERLISITSDNQGYIALAKNPTQHSRTKHINVQHHFVRKKLENQVICLKYCSMEYMIVDMLTKVLAKDKHQALTKAMCLETFDYLQSWSVEGTTLDCL